MLISHKNEFIHTRVAKNGSSTSQMILDCSGILGPDDIVAGYKDNPRDGFVGEPRNVKTYTWDELHDITEYGIPEALYKQKLPAAGAHAYSGHFTPLEMVRAGCVTEDQLLSYDYFGFVREPVDRWLSGYFFMRMLMGVTTPVRDHVDMLIQSGEMDIQVFFDRPQSSQFTYNGELIGTRYDYKNMISTLSDLVEKYGGTMPEIPHLKGSYRSAEFRGTSWIAPDSLEKLMDYLASDIAFYEDEVVHA